MDAATLKRILAEAFTSQTGATLREIELLPVQGGSINTSFKVRINQRDLYFAKQNAAKNFPHLFVLERSGLDYLRSMDCLRIPKVIQLWEDETDQLLLLEWVNEGKRTGEFWKRFGERLARLHQHTSSQFGFKENNYMGSLAQVNNYASDWCRFFIEHRLLPQLDIARKAGLLEGKIIGNFEALFRRLPEIFSPEPAALLHGDLWSGNVLCDEQENPVLIDPAVYYGHRSIDLGMTTLFGGFHRDFYSAYNFHYKLPSNHAEEWEVANLYPLLVHLNLFGEAYLDRIKSILEKYL